MPYKRNNINGTSPLDMKGMNDNFSALWLKVFGDINMSDIQDDVKSMLYTNWLQPQGEGNLDSTHPLDIRFYVPPNTKEVKTANLNIIASKYRVDSDVTSSAPSAQIAVATTSEGGGGLSLQDIPTLSTFFDVTPDPAFPNHTETSLAVIGTSDYSEDGTMHSHKIQKSYLSHHHYFVVDVEPHTHAVNANISIEAHSHELNMGVKEAINNLTNIKLSIVNSNGSNDIGVTLNEANKEANEINIASKIKIGEWNTIRVTSSDLARVTVFGIVELLQKYV